MKLSTAGHVNSSFLIIKDCENYAYLIAYQTQRTQDQCVFYEPAKWLKLLVSEILLSDKAHTPKRQEKRVVFHVLIDV